MCGCCCRDFGTLGTLPMFDFEKRVLEKVASERGIRIEFVPENVFLDKKSGTVFCLNWGLVGNPCPFLQNNKCSSYLTRPLICKAFPVEKIPEKNKPVNLGCFMHCPNNFLQDFIKNIEEDPKKDFLERYGEETIFAREEIEKIKKNIVDALKELEKEKLIEVFDASFIDFTKCEVVGVNKFLKEFI